MLGLQVVALCRCERVPGATHAARVSWSSPGKWLKICLQLQSCHHSFPSTKSKHKRELLCALCNIISLGCARKRLTTTARSTLYLKMPITGISLSLSFSSFPSSFPPSLLSLSPPSRVCVCAFLWSLALNYQ